MSAEVAYGCVEHSVEKDTTYMYDLHLSDSEYSTFLSYPPDLAKRLAKHDACIWALGKTSVGMNEAEYTQMSHGYVMNAVRALREAGVGEGRPEGDPFRVVYISGEDADPSGTSFVLFSQSRQGRNRPARIMHEGTHLPAGVLPCITVP
ncbi:uncharacterized protein C8Q71DRAFT_560062 [Rhodofomes roseus]|uniref:Uncharacterized protein n=1 Tax=Rhodofomes roseus TaxID=34475 RepID=A0ABQ8KJ01_9APHY|nr:uncharacterized protein C8Q71DRAFT_560062 [Rhodofomes roseus]KAH9837765.1 hypothetical protein C8Q71DRAFT_560062 [Rhodofomes roseus]